MKKYKMSSAKFKSIKSLFIKVLSELDENKLYHDENLIRDIMSEGAHGIIWHIDIAFEDIPKSVVNACEDFHDEVCNSFDYDQHFEEFSEQFIENYQAFFYGFFYQLEQSIHKVSVPVSLFHPNKL